MKNWKPAYKIAFISCIVIIFIGMITGLLSSTDHSDFAFAFGVICLIGALLSFVVAFFTYIASAKEQAKGFLLSGGILLLLSGISCGTGLAGANFH